MPSWINDIPTVYKAAGTVVVAVSVGWVAGLFVGAQQFVTRPEFSELHAVVDSIRMELGVVQGDVDDNTQSIDDIAVAVREMRDLLDDVSLNVCLTLAEVREDITTDRCRR